MLAAQGNAQEIGPASIPQAQPGVIPTGPMAPNAETPAGVYSNLGVNPSTDGYASNVPRSLITTESGGNWAAQNDAMGANGKRGHYGQLQFGHARLEDAKRAGIIPGNVTPEQFMADQQMQINTANWHFNDIDRFIKSNGLDQWLGKKVGGVTITMDGMRAMARLGGNAGLARYLQSQGASNPADINGTSLQRYSRLHANQ